MIEQESKDIVITYDTLYELLRNEKNKEELQQLNHSFFKDVVHYINDKQNNFNKPTEQQGLFEADEREKKIIQINNIKRLLKELYERREKKIISMALNKSRFSSSLINNSLLLEEERLFYEMLVGLLNSQRERILNKLLQGEIPNEINLDNIKKQGMFESAENLIKEKAENILNIQKEKDRPSRLIRFLEPVPQFIGEDLLDYGPYDEEDVAKLPREIADVLIQKERAEEIREN